MGEWPLRTIGDLVTLQRGIDLPDHSRTHGNVPIMGSFGITGRHDKAACRGPGVTVGRSGASAGTVCYIEEDYWPLNTCLYVRDFKNNDPRFAYYFLKTIDLAGMNSGSAQPSLNRNFVHPMPVRFPEPAEQRQIAAVLSALDDKIELNRRMKKTLEASARALFRDWFVDFGPTRAKAEGRPAYLAPDLWSLFPDRLGDDGVPEGWEWGTLAELADLNSESWGTRNGPATVRYVDLSNTKWGYIEATEVYDWADAPSRARRVLRPGDTIVGTVRPGNGSFAYIADDGLTGSTGFAVLRPKIPQNRLFVWCAATSPENIERLTHLADGGAYPAVRPDVVASTEIMVPPPALLSAFETRGAALLDRIEANKAESRTLAETRDTLLPKLMSGAIRVREDAARAEALL